MFSQYEKEKFDMSSTNKTPNYELNQWVNTDYFMMSDFNADNLAIDTALAGKANIGFGSYIGSGTAGSSSRVELTFAFTPVIVVVAGCSKNAVLHRLTD